MHSSYQPLKPATNKLLKKRWDGAAQDMHRRKVKGAKPVVDTKSPATYTHLQYKMKKMQLEEERHSIIDRDNRHLLEKMSAIMRTRGRVDNWNDYQPKSLNKAKRTRELIRVTLENQKILARIQAKQPQYSAKKWEEEWMETKKFMKSVRKYSEDWYQLQDAERRSRQTSRRQVTREERATTAADSEDEYEEEFESDHGEVSREPTTASEPLKLPIIDQGKAVVQKASSRGARSSTAASKKSETDYSSDESADDMFDHSKAVTPTKKSKTPLAASVTPDKSARKKAPTVSATPDKISTAPKQKSVTPVEKPATPAQKSATPVEKPATPAQKSATPAEKPATPAQKSATPAEKPATPAQKSATPAEKPATPAQKSATPAEKPATPAQKSATPAEKPEKSATFTPKPPSSPNPRVKGDNLEVDKSKPATPVKASSVEPATPGKE